MTVPVLHWPESSSTEDVSILYAQGVRQLRIGSLALDCKGLQNLDSTALATLVSLQKTADRLGKALQLENMNETVTLALASVPSLVQPQQLLRKQGFVSHIGTSVFGLFDEIRQMLYLFSESVWWSTLGRFDKGSLPFSDMGLQMVRLGANAVPIVSLLSFLIGLTLAFQSASQLETFGASIYLVRGVGISMFSEVGPMMTAVILAGRSGSSITAELASMSVQEEIKALRTMGIHPVQYLVAPRFQAMSITVPLLSFIAVLSGIFAGFLIAFFYLKLPVSLFFSELRDGVPLSLIWQCALKSLVFGWIIALVASQKGLAVRGGADAVGLATTKCVVFSISAIILADACFSFLFYW